MQTNEILTEIDKQISQLQQARALLAVDGDDKQTGKQRGRPKGSISKAIKASAPPAAKTSKRTMSEAGKARIAAAQKARWAARKKATKPAKPVVTQSAPANVKKAIQSAPKPKPSKKPLAPAKKTAPAKGASAIRTPETKAAAAGS